MFIRISFREVAVAISKSRTMTIDGWLLKISWKDPQNIEYPLFLPVGLTSSEATTAKFLESEVVVLILFLTTMLVS